MSHEKQRQLEELRLETKIEALGRVLESLKADKWSDVAKLGKDVYSACVKEEVSIGEQRKVMFAMLTMMGDQSSIRQFIESQEPKVRKMLDTARPTKEGKARQAGKG